MTEARPETVTLLFTDLEGSTKLVQALGSRYPDLLEEHHRILSQAVGAEQGRIFGTEGDATFAAFPSAACAVAAAAQAQRDLASHFWPDGMEVLVRMGIHTGEVIAAGDDYVGLDLHRAARIAAAGHGGQVLVSATTKALVEGSLPESVDLRSLGEHRLKDLSRAEHLYQLDISGLPTTFPPIRTLDAGPNNLPLQLTSFVGREREVADARQLLSATRLLTLTGPGGTGKTRLSLQIGAEETGTFAAGVFFVPLSTVVDPELVPSAIATALELREVVARSPRERLLDHLRDKEMLLLLDNFEQVLDAAPLISELLRTAPRIKALVTSRAALRVSGEQEYPVPTLRVPDPGLVSDLASLSAYEAVHLFIDRAVAVRPEFKVTNENAPAVAEITSRLDGLPLAIELAASRVKVLSPHAILGRLGHSLGLLSAGSRDLPERQRTLRGAIAWSYDMLEAPERRLFARFSVFAGGAELEQAEAVVGPGLEKDAFDGLASLVSNSLLRWEEDADGETRYSMLETIREFASERLEEEEEPEAVRRRHAGTYLELAESAFPQLTGRSQRRWLDRLAREADNFRAALDWAESEKEVEISLRLVAKLWRFWQMRGHLDEGRDRVQAALALPGQEDLPMLRSGALEAAGGITWWQGDIPNTKAYYSEALNLERRLGDEVGIANALYNLAFAVRIEGDIMGAGKLAEESLSLYRKLGDQHGVAKVSWAMADYLATQGDVNGAVRLNDESLAIFRRLGDLFGVGWSLHERGAALLARGDKPGARSAWTEALALFDQVGDVTGVVFLLDRFSDLAAAEGKAERAARLAGAVAALGRRSGERLSSLTRETLGESYPGYRANLTRESIEQSWKEGEAMSWEEAVAYALADE